jgi:sigma-B regulation protein RsbU (phosphoserine phosphatase)
LVYAGGRVTALAKGGVPLGIRAALPQLVQHSEPLPQGSMLVAFTDGVWERANARGEQYGEERLAQFIAGHAALPPQSFVQQLLEEVKNFGQSQELDDDVAIAVTKFLTKEV